MPSALQRSRSLRAHQSESIAIQASVQSCSLSSQQYRIGLRMMAGLIEAIDIKRKMFFEYENAPYHCLDVEISKPTARGGQTLVRVKMRNLLTRAVFDKTFKAGEKFSEPDLETIDASFMYADTEWFHFMDQETLETVMLAADKV